MLVGDYVDLNKGLLIKILKEQVGGKGYGVFTAPDIVANSADWDGNSEKDHAKEQSDILSVNVFVKNVRDLRDKVFQLVRQHTHKDCITLLNGKILNLDKGYQVTFQNDDTEDIHSKYFFTDDDYDEITNELIVESGFPACLSIIGGKPFISFRCYGLKQALQIAKEHHQEQIYDWKRKAYAPVKHS